MGQLAAEYTGPTALTKEYIRMGGQLVAIQNASGTPCSTCYLTYDHLGSVRLVTDQNANIVSRHDFLPFGEEIPAGYAGRSSQYGAADKINQRFTEQDRETENIVPVDYFNARNFTGVLGRFNSPDPGNAGADMMNPESWNGYSYVANNPLTMLDPSGMDGFGSGSGDDPCDWDPFCGGGWDGGPPPDWGSSPPPPSGPPPPPVSVWGSPPTNPNDTGVYAQGQFGSFPSVGNGILPGAPAAAICILDPVCLGSVLVVGTGGYLVWKLSPNGPVPPFPAGYRYTGPRFVLQQPTIAQFARNAGRIRGIPRVDQLQNGCVPGRTVEEPSTSLPGGRSIEQEYVCSYGVYTVHTLVDKSGKVVDMHVRPGPPKGGG